MENKKYYEEINIVRGMAILLVVIGHGLSDAFSGENGWINIVAHYLFDLIYSFHMPLFVLISGFCSYKILSMNEIHGIKRYICNRFARLLIPYFTWGIIYVFLDIFVKNYSWESFNVRRYMIDLLCGDNANWQLWTLYILFICSVVSVVIFDLLKIEVSIVILISSVFFAIRVVINEIPGLPSMLFVTNIKYFTLLYLFFCLGLSIRKNGLLDDSSWRNGTLFKFSILILLMNAFVGIIIENRYGTGNDWMKLLGAFTGMYTVFYLATEEIHSIIKKIFNMLGDNCMPIYLFANSFQVVIRKTFQYGTLADVSRLIVLLLSIIISVTGAIFIQKFILKHFKYLSILLTGNY